MAISATEARRNLFPLIRKVNDDRAPIEIVSRDGNAVLISEADYSSSQETAYLMSTPANVRAILEGMDQIRQGRVHEHELIP
jgi:antitoxin YefM